MGTLEPEGAQMKTPMPKWFPLLCIIVFITAGVAGAFMTQQFCLGFLAASLFSLFWTELIKWAKKNAQREQQP